MDHLTSDFSDLLHSSKSSVYGGPALEDDNPFAELQGNPSQVWASAAEFEASAPRNTSQDVPEASAVPDVPPESPGSVQSQGSQEQAVPGSPVSHKPDSQPPGLHIEAPFDLSRTSTPAESSYSAVVSPSLPSEQQESLFSSAPDDETPIQRSPDTSSSTPTATALDVRPDEHTTSVPETSADPWGERQPSHEPSPYNITSHTETGTETEPAARGHQETPPASEPPADFTLHQNDHEVSHDDVEAASISLTPEPSRPNYLITVSDPQKVGSDVTGSSHTVYTVKSISSAQGSQPRQVLRRFSDFLWLYDTLCANNPGCIVPPPPEKHAIGRFSGDFVEQRRKGLQVFLGKVAAHPMLWNDHDFAMFLTSDTFVLDVGSYPIPIQSQMMLILGHRSATGQLQLRPPRLPSRSLACSPPRPDSQNPLSLSLPNNLPCQPSSPPFAPSPPLFTRPPNQELT